MAKNDWDSFIGAVLGGIGLYALAKALSEKRCPRCNGVNHKNNQICQYCGWYFR